MLADRNSRKTLIYSFSASFAITYIGGTLLLLRSADEEQRELILKNTFTFLKSFIGGFVGGFASAYIEDTFFLNPKAKRHSSHQITPDDNKESSVASLSRNAE